MLFLTLLTRLGKTKQFWICFLLFFLLLFVVVVVVDVVVGVVVDDVIVVDVLVVVVVYVVVVIVILLPFQTLLFQDSCLKANRHQIRLCFALRGPLSLLLSLSS